MRVQVSPFDSKHYGLQVGRFVRDEADGPAELSAAIEAAQRERFAVVFLRLAAGDPLCGALEREGHAPVDTLVTSTLGRDRVAIAGNPAPAIEHHDLLEDAADIATVASITTESIRRSHLHADPRLPAARTRELYGAWAHNDVTGRAQRTIAARIDGELIGYLAVLATPGTAMIDLVAVRASWHGQRVGSRLIASFIDWIGDREIVATVGTQADNPALRLYASCGFLPTAMHHTYHLWLDA